MNNNICQFYIILGIKNFNYPKNNDVYINATNIKDLNELSKCILDSYKEKAKLGNKVLGEIIFIIPDEKYISKTQEIINRLKVNGKIKVLPQTTTQEKKVQTNNLDQKKELVSKPQKIKEENKKQEEKLEQPKPKVSIYQPEKNIYKSNYDNKTYTNLNKSKESNKKAIILFIISFIFFVISLILSFFM